MPVWKKVTTTALLLGLAHALTDASCGFLVIYHLKTGQFDREATIFLVLLYNTLAFGGQAPVGWFLDRFGSYRRGAVIGVLLVAQGLLIAPAWALAGAAMAGVGNALFHVGAGALVLNSSEDRAAESGVFVGPGAAGLAIGLMCGRFQVPVHWVFFGLLLLCAPYLWFAARPVLKMRPALPRIETRWMVPVLLLGLFILTSVAVRSMVGFTISGAWRGVSLNVLILLAATSCVGKMTGGFIGDRLGWATTSVVALALSAPLISAFVGVAPAAIIGMLLFQMTMAITLKAMHHVMPDRPGLAFGLPVLAIWFGALPGILHYGHIVRQWPVVLGSVIVSMIAVAWGIRLIVRLGGSGGPGRERIGWLVGRPLSTTDR